MFWSAGENKQLSNQSANLASRDARPMLIFFNMSPLSDYVTVDLSADQ